MRDNKSGFLLNTALLSTMLLTALAATYLFTQPDSHFVNYCMVPAAVVGMMLVYLKSVKPGVIWSAAFFAAVALLTVIFWPAQIEALFFWVLWIPVTLFSVNKLRSGVNGILAERDYYRSECARVAMIDSITQMRNMHAFLNDAPIYIKIAKRYRLTMVVMAIKLVNMPKLRAELDDDLYRELLEGVSRVMHNSIRLEDLAYLINNETGVWCVNMFTHVETIDIIIERLKKGLRTITPKDENDTPCELDFAFGHAVFSEDDEVTPATLLQRALEMAEKGKD